MTFQAETTIIHGFARLSTNCKTSLSTAFRGELPTKRAALLGC
jgi:hypothetical protein